MTKVVVILTEEGYFKEVLTDSEIDCRVLTEGKEDAEIDVAQSELELIERV